ncbi:glucokinase [Marilutibacter alkalisoli]|uniref:ROK family protein n=1 Tax=Marilutibacter alkalisoli TaxID=2591633 RepID=A0A514BVX4_9GAMM|nr:glucokinase [Lysobacter alkalisoli]QDH71455.1 ROK family protein [Lysobacter alkalisoli]
MSAAQRLVVAERRFIAADVGGTHTRVGLVCAGGAGESPVAVLTHRKYACAEYPDLAAIIADFIAGIPGGAGDVDSVAIACAGVMLDGVVVNANLHWRVSSADLRRALGLQRVLFINDFQAAAHAAQCMNPAEATLLTPGVETNEPGPVLVVGPGTGLGAAMRVPYRDGTVVLPTEAGHAAFAPGNPRELEVLRWLQRRGGHVPTEDLVSGPGLVNLYRALCAIDGRSPQPLDPSQISSAARDGDPSAREAVLTFCALLGSVIGDLAVVSSARSVFIAGGILPRLKDFIAGSEFLTRLRDKGAMRPVLERLPVRLIENDRLGVIGAASWYLQHGMEYEMEQARGS